MTAPDPDRFVNDLLAGLGTYPAYFHRLREVNRQGPQTFGRDLPRLARMGASELAGQPVVDVRPIDRFARGHIPGAVSIELRDNFGTWLGWLFQPDTPLIFMVDPDQDESDLVSQALNVGHENLAGRIGFDDWLKVGHESARIELIAADLITADTPILDVRQASEWAVAHVGGATHLELGKLTAHQGQVKIGSVVHCGSGQRAMTAASLLAQAGTPTVVTTASHSAITAARGGQ
jgi:rhodanese-related sulfurtransferase